MGIIRIFQLFIKIFVPECGFSAHELEPSSFSFNSPQGACLSCDGLGYLEYFDEELVVGDPSKSLPSGAIFGWDTRNSYYSQITVNTSSAL